MNELEAGVHNKGKIFLFEGISPQTTVGVCFINTGYNFHFRIWTIATQLTILAQ